MAYSTQKLAGSPYPVALPAATPATTWCSHASIHARDWHWLLVGIAQAKKKVAQLPCLQGKQDVDDCQQAEESEA